MRPLYYLVLIAIGLTGLAMLFVAGRFLYIEYSFGALDNISSGY